MRKDNEYTCRRFKAKHGMINLMVPKKPPTKEEIDEFYNTFARILVDSYKYKQSKRYVQIKSN